MSKPWIVRELESGEVEDYSKDELPGIPYGFKQEDIRNFAVEHEERGFVGGADLFEKETHYILMNCHLDEYIREKRYEGESPFADLIEARLAETGQSPVRTDAVTDHGKTQYKMEQYGFRPASIDPHPSPHSTPFVGLWRGEFGEMISNLPGEHNRTIDDSEIQVETIKQGGETAGLDYELIKPFSELEEGLHIYRVHRGEKTADELVEDIVEDNRRSENYAATVAVDPRFPQVEEIAEGLNQGGFDFTGFRPPVGDESGEVRMRKFNRPIYQISVTDQTIEFIEELGLDYRIEDSGEKSSEITFLP